MTETYQMHVVHYFIYYYEKNVSVVNMIYSGNFIYPTTQKVAGNHTYA